MNQKEPNLAFFMLIATFVLTVAIVAFFGAVFHIKLDTSAAQVKGAIAFLVIWLTMYMVYIIKSSGKRYKEIDKLLHQDDDKKNQNR